MKHMIRFMAALLCISLLAACGAKSPAATTAAPAPAPTETSPAPTDPVAPGTIKNIILIIGDGMGPNQVLAGELAKGKNFVFHDWQQTRSNTNSLDDYGNATKVTDSAAGGTALATGTLTINQYVGKDKDLKDLKTIMDHAQEFNKATGVVSTDSINGATPASFSGHAANRSDSMTIIYTQLESDIDLLCANATSEVAGYKSFIEDAGYTYCDTFGKVGSTLESDKAYWQFNMAGTSATDTLETVVPYALDFLDKDPDGFVLMIEQGHIDKYSHSNEIEGTQLMANSLNNTVEAILAWLGDRTDTAIIITADHETGGLGVSPEFRFPTKYSYGSNVFYYGFTSEGHTDTPVPVYFYGFAPKLDAYYLDEEKTTIKNIHVFDIMLDLLNNPVQEN